MFQALRIFGVVSGLSLAVGELYRRWDAWPFPAFWLDDIIAGGLVVIASLVVKQNNVKLRAFWAASWAFSCGMLYSSFWGKVERWGYVDSGNIRSDYLTYLVGFAFAVSIFGTVASMMLPTQNRD